MEGIIFKDIFIDNEAEFIEAFIKHLKANETEIEKAIKDLSNFLKNVSAKTLNAVNSEVFLSIWDQFEKQVLLNNKELQLIVGYRYLDKDTNKNTDVTYSGIISQKDATINGKIDAGSKAVEEAIEIGKRYQTAKEVQKFLTDKSKEFIDILSNNLKEEEAETLVLQQYNFVPKKWKGNTSGKVNQRIRNSWKAFVDKKWQDIYFGGEANEGDYYYGGQGIGKAYDAFMNHVANHHRQIFHYLDSQGQNYGNLTNNLELSACKNVYEKEGGVKGNFPRLLYDATNNTAWYTGGDIVIVDPETRAVIFNIQLKTTSKENDRDPTAFTIAISKLKTIINGGTLVIGKQKYTLKAFAELSDEDKAKQLYKYFKTSVSNYNEFQPMQDALDKDIKNSVDNLTNILET